jgi:hypothetical protein
MDELTFPKGDKNTVVTLKLQDHSGNIYAYSAGNSIYLNAWLPETPSTLVFSGGCVIVNTTSGTCTYTRTTGDFLSAGLYHAKVFMTRATGVEESLVPFKIKVPER